jgi:murein DD-endopeptidase MepM/ murein hydrolase activator NlpD
MMFPATQGRPFHDTMGDPRHGRAGGHRGQDIPAPLYSPIVAAKPGRVMRIYDRLAEGQHCGYGISIEHPGDHIRWTYCHMHRPPTHEDGSVWQVGENVAAGDFLGIVGTTGSSNGPHLHVQAITSSGAGHAVNLYEALRRAYVAHTGRENDMHAAGVDAARRSGSSSSTSSGIAAALVALVAFVYFTRGG